MIVSKRQVRLIVKKVLSSAAVAKKSQLLEKRQKQQAEWDYLLSEPFKARNHLACAWCNNAKSILEIGSYKNPLYKFYPSGNANLITVVDPKADSFSEQINLMGRPVKVVSHGKKLHEVKLPAHDAIVALGLAIPNNQEDGQKSLDALKAHCQLADTVILEGAVDWAETVEQIEEIIDHIHHEKMVDIIIDYSPSKVEDSNAPGKVYDKRRFVVLKK